MSKVLDIDKLVNPLSILYNALDTELFLSITSELDINIDNGGSEPWLQDKIKKTKTIEKANAKTIQKYTQLIIPQLNKIAKEINSTGTTSETITGVTNNFKREATKFINYTNTTALQSTNLKYLETVNTAYLDVETGLRTFQQSVTRATKQLADEGIKIQSYESGATINVRSGVARNIRTQTGKSAREIQETYAKEFDLSLFEVSSHAGARPKCFPDQGLIFDENGNNGEVKDVNGKTYKYKSVNSSSIGAPAGLFGINCTHMKYYIDSGAFTKTFEVYKKEENDIIYAYDQKVNYYKNEIEKEKRRLEGFKNSNNKEQEIFSNKKLKEKRKKLREFKKENLPKMEKLAQRAIVKPKPETRVNKDYRKLLNDYDDKDIKNIQDAMKEVLKTGKKNKAENMYTYDLLNNKKGFDTVLGEKSQVVFPEKYINYLKNTKANSQVIIHNHPKSSSFSSADINVLLNTNSVKEMLVIGHDKTLYRLSKTDKTRKIDITDKYRQYQAQLQIEYQDKFFKKYDELKDKLDINSKEFKDKVGILQMVTYKEQSHETLEKLSKYIGLDYRRILGGE